MKVIEYGIEEQGFRVLDPEEFFGRNIDDLSTHDQFFGHFTIIWRFFLHQRRFKAGESVWDLALKIAYEWENKLDKRIHKGTPYYFWGVTCIINGDLEKGFLLMHQALEEDKITFNADSPATPAYSFVTLDYEKQDQFFKQKVEEITNFIDGKLGVYRSSREGTLNLSEFKSRFLEIVALREVVFYFVFESFHLKKLLGEIDQRLTRNALSSLLQANTIFTLCLIIDNVLKHKNTGQWKFPEHLKFLSTQSSLTFNDQKIGELNGAFRNYFSDTVQKLLSSEYHFQDEVILQPIEEDFAFVYGFRNFGAHRIEDQPVIYQNFDKISERILNALFFSIEKLYP